MSPYRLHINNSIEHHFLDVTRILYFKSNGNYTNVTFCDGTEIINIPKQLGQIARIINNTLPSELKGNLVQVGRYYIVNTSHIQTMHISKRLIIFAASSNGNTPISISPSSESLIALCAVMSDSHPTSTYYPTSAYELNDDWTGSQSVSDDSIVVLGDK